MRPMILAALLALSTPLLGQAPSLSLNFTPSADDFRAATEYGHREGRRIVEAMERATGFRFEPGPMEVSIYEGTSYSGERGGRPMLLRASYAEETKRGTLVHELAHRLAADVPFKGDHRADLPVRRRRGSICGARSLPTGRSGSKACARASSTTTASGNEPWQSRRRSALAA